MLSTYEEESGFRPENESDIMLRLRVFAGEIFKQRTYAEYIMRQMFPATSEGEYLDQHAAQRNLTRKAATYATGKVWFYPDSDEHSDITIPAGTVVCTENDARRFTTDSDAVLLSSSSFIDVNVTAAAPGSAYNAAVSTVKVIVTPVIGIGRVNNLQRITGGSDTESDDMLRERINDSYRNISNGTNAAYYRSVAMSVDGVYSAGVVGCGRGAGTVDVYVSGKGTTVPSGKLQEIQSLLSAARELNVDVRVFNASVVNINLYIRLVVADGYDFNTVADEVQSAVTEYINALGVGHDVLLSNIGEVIYHVKGVADYRFLESYGSDRPIAPSRYAAANNILVRDE